jgi:hypothetical protein
MVADLDKDIVKVVFTFRGKYDPDETITLSISNQVFLDDNEPYENFPILETISNIGTEMDEFFPKFRDGTISIDNSRDSLAFQRRFTDLSATYVIQGATVQIFAKATQAIAETLEGSFNLVWEGEIQRVNYTTNNTISSQRLSIGIGRPEPEHLVTKKLRRSEFPDIPDRSVNKYLPLVLGFNQQVIPYPIEQPVAEPGLGTKMNCAYATNLEGDSPSRFRNGGITRILAPDLNKETNQDSVYHPVLSAPDIVTFVYQTPGTVTSTLDDLSKPVAFWIPYFPGTFVANSYIVTGITLSIQGNGEGLPNDVEGELSIRIHRQRPNFLRPKPPSEQLAEAVVVKEDYADDYATNNIFFVQAVFDKPVPIVGAGTYWISIQGSKENEDAAKTKLPLVATVAGTPAGLETYWKTPKDDTKDVNGDTWEPGEDSTQSTASFFLSGLVMGDFPSGDGSYDLDGLGYSYNTLRYQDFASTHPQGQQQVEDLTRIDLIYEITGLLDTDGTVTDVPNFILGNPIWQIEALFYTFDGNNWNEGPFDDFKFTETHIMYTDINEDLFRETAGRTFNKTTNIRLIRELARNSYSSVVYDTNTSAGVYQLLAHGKPRQATFFTDDSSAVFERYFINDLEEVINVMDINYARRLDNVHFQSDFDQEDLRDYSKTLEVHYRDGDIGEEFGAISYEHYGERRLKNENFDFIASDISALAVAELFLRLHDHPYEYAQLSVPYWTYSTLALYDIIQIKSTEIPSHFGTTPVQYRSDEDCRIAGPMPGKTRPLLGEVVALTFSYNRAEGATLNILARLITQQNDPVRTFKFRDLP